MLGLGRRPATIRPMMRWATAAGVFVVSLDSMVNVAFPAMARAFGVAPTEMRWVIVGYVGTYALLSFAGGALGDRAGHGRVFVAGAALGALGLALAGLAPTFGWHLAGRVVQGIAGGLVYGTAPALVTLGATPAARGRALGFLTGVIGLAFAAGPLVAGLLVGAFGWRAVFLLRVPPALGALAWALRALPRAGLAFEGRLAALASAARLSVLHAGLLSFVAHAGIFAIWLLAPFYLAEARGLDAPGVGLLFTLTPLGMAVGAPLGGRLADRLGARLPMAGGLLLEAAGLGLLSRADPAAPLGLVALALLAAGLGLGLFQAPNLAAVMAEFPGAQQGAGGGFGFLARTLGIVAGVLLLARLHAARRASAGAAAAFADSFLAAALAVAAAAALALLVRRRPAGP
jgi:MFS family permease